jgi:ABC-type oligopeptide transport system substrate-binding subunit
MSACAHKDQPYFGKTTPPSDQRLVFEIQGEPETLDPAKTSGGPGEWNILPALFEGLTATHPGSAEPVAGLATHYEVAHDQTRYTFYLRGHATPRGHKLPDTGEAPTNATGEDTPRRTRPARWSDGATITAHDFVDSWRRAVRPETGAYYAPLLDCLRNAAEINAGRRGPEHLGVRALDEFTLAVELETPVPFFLRLVAVHIYAPVPRQSLTVSGDLRTHPNYFASSGAFTLREWRPYDVVVIKRNPYYYDADLVRLREIAFVPISDANTMLNFYKSGDAHSINDFKVPYLAPALRGKHDYYTRPMFGAKFYTFNVTRPPFDNVLLRYAFNMAVDKSAIAQWMGEGRKAARTFVPPLEAYRPPSSLPLKVEGKEYDVLAFNPAGARELLRLAGFPGGRQTDGQKWTVEVVYPDWSAVKVTAEILQQQWRRNLGIDVQLIGHDFPTFLRVTADLNYPAIADSWDCGLYTDPNWFLAQFRTGSRISGTGWSDSRYDALLARANAAPEPVERMTKLAECERYLLTAMPVIPLYFDSWSYLQKPYVRGGGGNLLNIRRFKHAWIDTNWRPQ